MRSPADIYSERFALGHTLPSKRDPREELMRQLETSVPDLWPTMARWEEIEAFKSSDLRGEARLAERQRLVAGDKDFWNPLMEYCQATDSPFLAHLMLLNINSAPIDEIPLGRSYLYPFWVHALMPNTTNDYYSYLKAVVIDHNGYKLYLNANDNRGPNSPALARRTTKLPPDENLAREVLQILTLGSFVIDNDVEALTEASLILTGLFTNGFYSRFHEPGDRVFLGQVFPEGGIEQIESWLRFLVGHEATARTQTRRLVQPIIGGNLTSALHDALIETWLNTGGNRAEVLKTLVQHDDAWNPSRKTPSDNLVAFVRHMNEFKIPFKKESIAFSWFTYDGYQRERAPNPEGLLYDERLLSGPSLARRLTWPGTLEQQITSMSFKRALV